MGNFIKGKIGEYERPRPRSTRDMSVCVTSLVTDEEISSKRDKSIQKGGKQLTLKNLIFSTIRNNIFKEEPVSFTGNGMRRVQSSGNRGLLMNLSGSLAHSFSQAVRVASLTDFVGP